MQDVTTRAAMLCLGVLAMVGTFYVIGSPVVENRLAGVIIVATDVTRFDSRPMQDVTTRSLGQLCCAML